MTIADQVASTMNVDMTTGALRKVSKKLRAKPAPALTEDPIARLRELVMQHRRLGKLRVANANMSGDKKIHKGPLAGQIRKSPLAEDEQAIVKDLNKVFGKRQDALKAEMHKELRRIPLYEEWLKDVAGVGPILAAYLISQVDITKATKPSNLIRFCGNAVIDGRRDTMKRGEKAHFSSELRCQLYVWFSGLVRGKSVGPKSDKYLDVAANYAHRMRHSERVDVAKNTIMKFDGSGLMSYRDVNGKGFGGVSAKNFVFNTGRRKAIDVLLEDIYIVWRSLSGLPVWAGYYAEKLGYRHGGKIAVQKEGPQFLDLAGALALVGDCGSRRVETAPCVTLSVGDAVEDDAEDEEGI